jgi:phytoene/squalene synthetase
MQAIHFYQNHLDRVSRSFAFCIQELPEPLRQWTSLSYLLCRALDTVEDSLWPRATDRDQQYEDFERFLGSLPSREAVALWTERFPASVPQSERDLARDAFLLFDDLHGLPVAVRRAIQKTVRRMSAGMQYYSQRQSETGVLRLSDATDVNRYCYFVAGVVGELLTHLFLEYRPDFRPDPSLLKNAFHFGLFLQKVNLLKDQHKDEAEGRFLVPDREQLLGSLRENLLGAFDYLIALPLDEKGYRTFCAWSLFLGAASLPFLQQNFQQKDGTKISREVTRELLGAIAEQVQDNQALRSALQEFLPLLPVAAIPPAVAAKAENHDWFTQISGDVLRANELSELRMI